MNTTSEQTITLSVEEFAKGLEQARDHSRIEMEKAKKVMEKPTRIMPSYDTGDVMWFSIRKEERKPFGPMWRGPYLIIVKKGRCAYQIDKKGPKHHVYHEGRIKLYVPPEVPSQERELPIVHGKELRTGKYEVEMIVGHKTDNGQMHYLVKWARYDEEENTWELEENLDNAKRAVNRYWRQGHLHKKGGQHVRTYAQAVTGQN